MKVMILEDYYGEFLKTFYEREKGLKDQSFEIQMEKLQKRFFGIGGRYFENLRELNYDVNFFVYNNYFSQIRWMKEKNKKIPFSLANIRKTPISNDWKIWESHWYFTIIEEQIKFYKPDVLFINMSGIFPPSFLKKIKMNVKILVGQIASMLPSVERLNPYDLIVSSLPNLVEDIKNFGIDAELLPLAFETSILDVLKKTDKKKYKVSFVGGVTNVHSKNTKIVENLAKEIPVDFWGYGVERLNTDSPLMSHYHGEAWGLEMFQILSDSLITINRHSDILSPKFANNMRLFEATGCGALLITDKRDNLKDLFNVGEEVVEYSSEEDLINKVKYYLDHQDEAKKIALAGQRRTIKDHNYKKRSEQLMKIIKNRLEL